MFNSIILSLVMFIYFKLISLEIYLIIILSKKILDLTR